MKPQQKRVRMFAGPNGSGKSLLKLKIAPELIYTYINPDEMEVGIREKGYLDLNAFQLSVSEEEVLAFFSGSSFLQSAGLSKEAKGVRFFEGKVFFSTATLNSYFTSVASDFIRHKLLELGRSFSFETVMSSRDKVQFLRKAQDMGYRTYLYYVATKDPKVNIDRIKRRVELGGHGVPEDKIISRYHRSLALLPEAIRNANRAYLCDNTTDLHFFGEVTDAKELILHSDEIPGWAKVALQDTLVAGGLL
jgi:predicted ABC-type ATPase